MRDTQVLDNVMINHIEAEHEDGACCVGCKIEGFIADLKKSGDKTDQALGHRFQRELERFNYEQEQLKRPRRSGC